MSGVLALGTASVFIWVGLVVGISFLETPLKFRAPGVTTQIGLGIGRLVFRALNLVELGLAIVLVVALVVGLPPARVTISAATAVVVLLLQVLLVRPLLKRRSDRVLGGEQPPRSHAHYWYVGLEVAKLVALVTAGALLLAA